MRVVFADAARADLRNIAIFITGDSPPRARSLLPNSQAPVHRWLTSRSAIRSYRNMRLMAFAVAITIVRVLHAAMDLDVALGGS